MGLKFWKSAGKIQPNEKKAAEQAGSSKLPEKKARFWQWHARALERKKRILVHLQNIVELTAQRDALIQKKANIDPEREKKDGAYATTAHAARGMALNDLEVRELQFQINKNFQLLAKDAKIRNFGPKIVRDVFGPDFELTNLGWSGKTIKEFGENAYFDLGLKKNK